MKAINNDAIKVAICRGELMGSWSIVTGDAAFKAFHLYKYEQVCVGNLEWTTVI